MKTKAGKVAKRQPQYDERPKSYYQAQCSFRGLKTSGGKDELQQLLQHRDLRKDLEIQDELDQLDSDINAYGEEQEELRLEEWWKDPATTFEDRLLQSPERALQEEMQNPDSFLLHSCRILRGHWYGLSRATAALSLGYEAVSGPVDLPPDCEIQQCYIIGEAKAVATNARAFKKKTRRRRPRSNGRAIIPNSKLQKPRNERGIGHFLTRPKQTTIGILQANGLSTATSYPNTAPARNVQKSLAWRFSETTTSLTLCVSTRPSQTRRITTHTSTLVATLKDAGALYQRRNLQRTRNALVTAPNSISA